MTGDQLNVYKLKMSISAIDLVTVRRWHGAYLRIENVTTAYIGTIYTSIVVQRRQSYIFDILSTFQI